MAGEAIKVWAAHADDTASGGEPGEVMAADADGIRVATGAGVLVLTELQRAGGKRLAVADFLRGFPLARGQVLDAVPSSKAGA
ncbi:Methionyl-tRNA formyltransferase [compost metagenome]